MLQCPQRLAENMAPKSKIPSPAKKGGISSWLHRRRGSERELCDFASCGVLFFFDHGMA